MNTPSYVVRKIGDRYVTVKRDTGPLATTAWIVGGTCLALRGVQRGGLRGGIAFMAGIGFIVRGALGYNPMAGCCGDSASPGRARHGPSYQNDGQRRSRQMPEDVVDEQSMESFPASDAAG
jgi:hypothetical protein